MWPCFRLFHAGGTSYTQPPPPPPPLPLQPPSPFLEKNIPRCLLLCSFQLSFSRILSEKVFRVKTVSTFKINSTEFVFDILFILHLSLLTTDQSICHRCHKSVTRTKNVPPVLSRTGPPEPVFVELLMRFPAGSTGCQPPPPSSTRGRQAEII
jgi:hypothetical protein